MYIWADISEIKQFLKQKCIFGRWNNKTITNPRHDLYVVLNKDLDPKGHKFKYKQEESYKKDNSAL